MKFTNLNYNKSIDRCSNISEMTIIHAFKQNAIYTGKSLVSHVGCWNVRLKMSFKLEQNVLAVLHFIAHGTIQNMAIKVHRVTHSSLL